MAELILHIGAHRCASTTLQHALREDRGRLSAAGLDCWLPGQTRAGLLAGLVCRPDRLTEEVEVAARTSRDRIRRLIDGLGGGQGAGLLISDENLAGSIRRNLTTGRLYPDIAGRLQRLGPDLCARVGRVAITLRSYDDYWSSALRIGLWRGLPAPGPAALERMQRLPRRWPAVLADVMASLPAAEIVVMPFALVADRPARAIAAMTGLPASGDGQVVTRHNAAPAPGDILQRLQAGGQAGLCDLLAGQGGDWAPFPAPEAMAAAYQEDLAALAQHGGRLRLLRAQGAATAAPDRRARPAPSQSGVRAPLAAAARAPARDRPGFAA